MDILELLFSPVAKFGLGFMIGISMLVLDQVWFYRFYSYDLAGTRSNTYLISRSILFLLLYLPLLLYVLTSSGSFVGLGVSISLGWGLSLELLRLRRKQEQFHHRFLWQIKRVFSQEEIDWLVRVFVGAVLIATILCLRSFR